MEILWWLQSKEEEMIVKMIYTPLMAWGTTRGLIPQSERVRRQPSMVQPGS